MINNSLKISFGFILFIFVVAFALPAQNEAASSATDAQLESQTNSQVETIKIGKKVIVKRNGERRLSPPLKFEGVVDSLLVVENDSIPISSINMIQEINPKMNDWGIGLTIFGLVYLLGFVVGLVWSTYILPFGIYYGTFFSIFFTVGLLGLFLIPITLVLGISFLAFSKRSFQLGRKWKLRGKPQTR